MCYPSLSIERAVWFSGSRKERHGRGLKLVTIYFERIELAYK